MTSDVVVIGSGLIGLSISAELASRGVSVTLIGDSTPGEASPAAAGMLAPSVERASGPAHEFAVASRDLYPTYLANLTEQTGVSVGLNRLGILQLAISPPGVKGLKKSILPGASWLDAVEVREREPNIKHALGAVFSPNDGSVNNVSLLEALQACVKKTDVVRMIERVTEIRPGSTHQIMTEAGSVIRARQIVVAAGAWTSMLRGLRHSSAIKPSRGQMLAFESQALSHVVYGPRGYLVPRADRILAGSTMEDVGFDSRTTSEGISRIQSAAAEIYPALGAQKPSAAWAGLRPVTPDLLPLLGPDPENPGIVYACGHSRNGVLLAPLTAAVVADLVMGSRVAFDLTQFRPDRFSY